MKTIAVIGAGTMGSGIAHTFAQFGYTVAWIDVAEGALEKGRATIAKNLDRMVAKSKLTPEEKSETLARISTTTVIAEGVKDAELVVEAATEDSSLKIQLFEEMDKHTSAECILATNTSSISITQIAAATSKPERVIGMHFMNPVPMMKLVEIIRGYSTSDAVTQTVVSVAESLNKTAVEVNDYPGFVANRILMPMINEAVITLNEGIAGVEAIDTVMKLGMSHPMGPLQLADFIGLDVCLAILKVLHQGLGNDKYAPCPLLVNMVNAGKLGVKSGDGFYQWKGGTKELKANLF